MRDRPSKWPHWQVFDAKAPWFEPKPAEPPNNDLVFSGTYSPPDGDNVDLIFVK